MPRSRNERNVSEYESAKGTASEYERVCPDAEILPEYENRIRQIRLHLVVVIQ